MSMLDAFSLTTSLIPLVPALILFRNYKLTSSKDFLLFALLLIASSIDLLAQNLAFGPSLTLWRWLTLIARSARLFTYFVFLLLVIRMKWDRVPVIFWYLGVPFYLITQFFIIFLYNPFDPANPVIEWLYLFYVYQELSRLNLNLIRFIKVIIGATILFVTFISHPISSTKRVKLIFNLWRVVGFLMLIGTCLEYYYYLIDDTLEIIRDINEIGFAIIFMITAILGIFFPESLLYTQTQLVRAIKLYKILDQNNPVVSYKKNWINEYLKNIPPEILLEIQPD